MKNFVEPTKFLLIQLNIFLGVNVNCKFWAFNSINDNCLRKKGTVITWGTRITFFWFVPKYSINWVISHIERDSKTKIWCHISSWSVIVKEKLKMWQGRHWTHDLRICTLLCSIYWAKPHLRSFSIFLINVSEWFNKSFIFSKWKI